MKIKIVKIILLLICCPGGDLHRKSQRDNMWRDVTTKSWKRVCSVTNWRDRWQNLNSYKQWNPGNTVTNGSKKKIGRINVWLYKRGSFFYRKLMYGCFVRRPQKRGVILNEVTVRRGSTVVATHYLAWDHRKKRLIASYPLFDPTDQGYG